MPLILVIDDNEDNLFIIKTLIKATISDVDIITAQSGEEGIKIAKRERPDVIILDILMPTMDGFETCDILKCDTRTTNIPVILLTAIDNNSSNRTEGLLHGADAFLSKPIDEKELAAQIRAMLKKKNDRDILYREVEKKEWQRKEEEKKFQIIFNGVQDGIIVYRWPEGAKPSRILEANQIGCRQLKYTKEEILDLHPLDLFLPSDHYKLDDVLEEIEIRGNKLFELSQVKKDGDLLPVEIKATSYYVGNDRILLTVNRDISRRKAIELSLIKSFEKLERSLSQIIDVLSLTVETRDPYTSGHQKRVAIIAKEIAKDMDLCPEKKKAIFMAAMIHDIGKINIPAEILSKPGKLTETELALIQQHPSIGYEITKVIDFEAPISQIIKQHHERMNGSGYPEGLKGEDILPEARILAVADVLEAMSSHRPYRPALGMSAALEEIRLNRGNLYDPLVVDSVLSLAERGILDKKL